MMRQNGRLCRLSCPLRSAFISFWAFNEADVDAREKIRPDIQKFGRILMAIAVNKGGRYGFAGEHGVDVLSYFENFVKEHLIKTHNICIWNFQVWKNTFPAGGYYFVAVRKELPPPQCLESLNCYPTNKHPSIPSTC